MLQKMFLPYQLPPFKMHKTPFKMHNSPKSYFCLDEGKKKKKLNHIIQIAKWFSYKVNSN